MNSGAFGENFPYSNFHDLNMDWIIKIAKDFLDQYSHIQEIIENGEQSIVNLTEEGLEQLQTKATELEGLLQEWYNTHSEDIANQLRDALAEVDNYLDDILEENRQALAEYAEHVMSDLPEDYTVLANQHNRIYEGVQNWDLSRLVKLEDTYINNGTPTTLSGYNLYKIPINKGDVVIITYDHSLPFWGSLNANYAICWEYDNPQRYLNIGPNTTPNVSTSIRYFFNTTVDEILMYCLDDNPLNICLTCLAERYNTVRVSKNYATPVIDWVRMGHKNSFICPLNEVGIPSQFFDNTSNNYIGRIPDGYLTYTLKVEAGDNLRFINSSITGLSYLGTFRDLATKTSVRIENTNRYTAPADGFMSVFEDANNIGNTFIDITKSSNSFISPNQTLTDLAGYDAVAFGTSITYRQTSYLPILADLTKIIFDNQGEGNATLYNITGHPNMLNKILNYEDYSNKEIIFIEGFVNDWYSDSPLGQASDTGTSTLCGCFKTALAHLHSIKPSAEVIIIFDHYGRLWETVNCDPYAQNSFGLTQADYYNELAKICDSIGIPHIDLYKIARMSNAGCLLDDIHPTPRGAKRMAWLIRQFLALYQYPVFI